jgi:hypothetical protein
MNREYWVEEVSKPNAVRFRNQPEEPTVPIEAPRTAMFEHLQAWLIMAIKQFVRYAP